jgi:hypothetical protein
MHYITIPETVNIKTGGDSQEDLPFEKFLETAFYDPKMGKTAKDIVRVIKLKDLFETVSEGDIVPVEDADYEKLKDVVDAPTSGYNPRVMTQCYKYIEAILEAPVKDPREVEDAPETKEQ